jgi:hypothetical protein
MHLLVEWRLVGVRASLVLVENLLRALGFLLTVDMRLEFLMALKQASKPPAHPPF